MKKHKCNYTDLASVIGNDEEFIWCMRCGKEFTSREAKKLEKKKFWYKKGEDKAKVITGYKGRNAKPSDYF